jgi:hypothetical protein
MKLVSTLDGQILWANAAFCDWSQYTLTELRRLTWMSISVPDKSLEADVDEARNLDAYNPTYQVKKQYIPKGAKPEWGQLTVMRYPLNGEIECCLCTWEPLKNGTATAFAMAMEHTQKLDARIEAMTMELRAVTTQTDEDKFVLGAIRMVQRHPKIAASFLFIALSIFGLNNVVELLQRTGLIQLPVKVERTEAHAAMVHEISDPVSVLAVASEYSATSPSGLHIAATKLSDGRTGSLSVVRRRGIFNADANRDSPDSTGGVGVVVGGSDGRTGSLSSGTSGIRF